MKLQGKMKISFKLSLSISISTDQMFIFLSKIFTKLAQYLDIMIVIYEMITANC